MKTLNGNQYFEKLDIEKIIGLLLINLNKRDFVQNQSVNDVILIENAIKKFLIKLIDELNTEFALNMDYIEKIYNDIMHPACNLLDPRKYDAKNYEDITSKDMKMCENWYFNYGISLVIAEFEKI
tara:strand:+ start:757 stop:1131 length:375 start_codon:yes stop_codon:yes gene_type:complete